MLFPHGPPANPALVPGPPEAYVPVSQLAATAAVETRGDETMAHVAYAAETRFAGLSLRRAFRRSLGAWQVFWTRLAADDAAARRDHRLRRLARCLDRRQLQDIGLDRNRC